MRSRTAWSPSPALSVTQPQIPHMEAEDDTPQIATANPPVTLRTKQSLSVGTRL